MMTSEIETHVNVTKLWQPLDLQEDKVCPIIDYLITLGDLLLSMVDGKLDRGTPHTRPRRGAYPYDFHSII